LIRTLVELNDLWLFLFFL